MNAKADIWMPFYIGDYFADTMHLNAEQHGAYLLLLFTYWKRRRPLPNDPVFLANAARLSSDAWSIHQAVLKEFFDTSSGNAWVHHRVESELLKATDKKQKAAEKAKKAAEGRWKNASSNASSITQEMLKECPSPSPSPSHSGKDKRTPKADAFGMLQILQTFPTLDESVAKDFISHRKLKRAPLTQSAWDGIAREIMSSGWTPDRALREAMARGWQAFKADWVANKPDRFSAKQNADDVSNWVPAEMRGTKDDPLYTGDYIDAIQ